MQYKDLDEIYSDKIDCRLDYHNVEELINLFEEAKSISPQSVFRFLEELSRAPTYNNKSSNLIKKLQYVINYIELNFKHPLKEMIIKVIIAKLNGAYLPIRRALILMNGIRIYEKSYSILNIILFSVRRNTNIVMVERFYEDIIKQWSPRSA